MHGVRADEAGGRTQHEGSGRRPADGIRPVLFDVAVLALGFGFCRAWALTAISLAGGVALFEAGPFQYGQVHLAAGVVGALVAVACSASPAFRRLVPGSPMATIVALVLVSLVCMGVAWSSDSRLAYVLAFALSGASSGLLQIAWGERFARHGMRVALFAAPAAAIVVAVLMTSIPAHAEPACFFAMPCLSIALWCTVRGDARSITLSLRPHGLVHPVEAHHEASVSKGTFARLMASIAVFSLTARTLDAFCLTGAQDGLPLFAYHDVYVAVAVAGVLFIVLVAAFGKHFDVLFVYRLALPCMVAGFIVLTLFVERLASVSVGAVTVGYEFFEILFWVVLAGIVHRDGRDARAVFGWGIAATYAGMLAGTVLGAVLARPVAQGVLDIAVLSMGGILLLVVLVALVLPEGILSRASKDSDAVCVVRMDEVGFEEKCAAVAQRYGLTPREFDVLKLVARGRTLAVVSRELQIAQGTARTHMSRVYAKLGVHKQQDLIDLVEKA